MVIPPDTVTYEMVQEWDAHSCEVILAVVCTAKLATVLEALGPKWLATSKYVPRQGDEYLIIDTTVSQSLTTTGRLRIFTSDRRTDFKARLHYPSLSISEEATFDLRKTVTWLFKEQEKARHESVCSTGVV